MMKIFGVAAVIVLGGIGQAAAADLGNGKMQPAYASDVTASPTWGGWYVGGHVGYGWGEFDGVRSINHGVGQFTPAHCNNAVVSEEAAYPVTEAECTSATGNWIARTDAPLGHEAASHSDTLNMDGLFGGLDLSYKIKAGQMIFEPFIDVSWGGGKGSVSWERDIIGYVDADGATQDITEAGLFENGHVSVEKNWDSTLGLKAGFLVTPSDYLYGLAGLKYGSFTMKGGSTLGATGNDYVKENVKHFPISAYSSDEDQWGYTLGIGLEHAINNRLHVGVEGRYTAYSDIKSGYSKTADVENMTLSTSDALKGDYDEWSVLGRISYRFGTE
jgi:outer membrane immunogenic protein